MNSLLNNQFHGVRILLSFSCNFVTKVNAITKGCHQRSLSAVCNLAFQKRDLYSYRGSDNFGFWGNDRESQMHTGFGIRWKTSKPKRASRQVCAGWRRKDTKNVAGRAKILVEQIKPASDYREDVYAILDNWCAWETVFPMLALKSALEILKVEGEWKRIIQISKWMLSKGQGNSLGTYRLMIEAYHRLGRVNEMEELWTNTLQTQLESMPRGMFSHIMRIYIERENFYKVLEVWGSMQALDIRPNSEIVDFVYNALINVKAEAQAKALKARYPPEEVNEFRRKKWRKGGRDGSSFGTEESSNLLNESELENIISKEVQKTT